MTCKDCIHCVARDPDGNVYCDVIEGWGADMPDATLCRGYQPAYRKEEENK